MAPKWTDQQLKAIQPADRLTVLSAAAGSGSRHIERHRYDRDKRQEPREPLWNRTREAGRDPVQGQSLISLCPGSVFHAPGACAAFRFQTSRSRRSSPSAFRQPGNMGVKKYGTF